MRARSPARRTAQIKDGSRKGNILAEEIGPSDEMARWFVREGSRLVVQKKRSGETKDGPKRSFAGRLLVEISSIFLPVGYPSSVRAEYLRFQTFDTLQAACSYLRNIITTAALLRGAGVGQGDAAPLAAAVAWVLRDGLGMLGSLLFSYVVGSGFDRNVKEWRLFADVINDVGLTLDMIAPLAGRGSGFTVVAALGAACKSVCGLVAGACRASITAHFALRGNLADVSAKENAQETAVSLLFMLLGTLIAQRLDESQLTCWVAFLTLTMVHVWANWLGVGSLALVTINCQRATILCRAWWACMPLSAMNDVLTPKTVANHERPWGPLMFWLTGPRLGVQLHELLDQDAADGGWAELSELCALYLGEDYILRCRNGVPCIALCVGATGATLLKAMLHCSLLISFQRSSCGQRWVPIGPRREPSTLPAPAARRPPFAVGMSEHEAGALRESLAAVQREWPKFADAVLATGWAECAVRLDCAGGTRIRVDHAAEGEGL